MKLLLILGNLILATCLMAQDAAWNVQSRLYKNDELQHLVEDGAGNIVSIGTADQRTDYKQDILFWKCTPSGVTTDRHYIGSIEEEYAYSIACTFDGGYIVAGSSSTRHQEQNRGQDALLLKLNEDGHVLWSHFFGGDQTDAFLDVVQSDDGSILATGYKAESVYIVKCDFNGDLVWEKNYPNWQGQANSLLLNDAQEILLTGFQKKKGKKQAIALKIDANTGTLIWRKTLDASKGKLEEGKDIILLDASRYMISGTVKSKKYNQESQLITINEAGEIIEDQSFGALGNDGANAIAKRPNGGLVLAGFSSSHKRGARRNNLLVQNLSPNQQGFIAQQPYYNGYKQDDQANDVIVAHTGNTFAAGSIYYNKQQKSNGNISKFRLEDSLQTAIHTNLSISNIQFTDENHNDTLETFERGFISFELHNHADTALHQLQASTQALKYRSGIEFERNLIIGDLAPNSSKVIGIPMNGGRDMRTGISEFLINIKNSDATVQQNVVSKRIPAPELAITDTLFIRPVEGKLPDRGEKITLKVKVKNIGEVPANGVILQFSTPYKVEPIGERRFELGTLEVDSARIVSFDFFARSYYAADSLQIKVVAWENTMRGHTLERLGLKLRPFLEMDIYDKKVYPTLPETSNRGPNLGTFPLEIEEINWLAPESKSTSPNGVTDLRRIATYKKETFDIKLGIVSLEEIDSSDISLLINDTLAVVGQNFDLENVYFAFNSKVDGSYQYIFIIKELRLNLRKNVLRLKVKDRKSSRMTVIYEPEKPNLHVYSVGIPYDNLKYTTKDAQDFAASFDAPHLHQLYDSIYVHTFTDREQTTDDFLELMLDDIFQAREIREEIEENDIIMVFFSSHGFLKNGDFYIIGSDYDKTKITFLPYSINFRDVYTYLDEVKDCKKVLFVDACYSGAATAEGAKSDEPFDILLANALIDLVNTKPGYNVLLSCSENEKSHEDDAWENGAFTEALLEAFNKEVVQDSTNTAQEDRILYFHELHDFVRERVKTLVKKEKNRKQTPKTPEEQLRERDIPIYILKKEEE